jgi:hypothetical protein
MAPTVSTSETVPFDMSSGLDSGMRPFLHVVERVLPIRASHVGGRGGQPRASILVARPG